MDINYNGVVNVAKTTLPPRIARQGEGTGSTSPPRPAGSPPSARGPTLRRSLLWSRVLKFSIHENHVRRALCLRVPAPSAFSIRPTGHRVAKVFDQIEHLQTDAVLDAIEHALDHDEFFVFPGRARLGWRLRRWLPNLIWRRIHAAEGTP